MTRFSAAISMGGLFVGLLALTGCRAGSAGASKGQQADTEDVPPGASPDASPIGYPGANVDASPDVSPDASADVSPDASADASADFSPDASFDASPDASNPDASNGPAGPLILFGGRGTSYFNATWSFDGTSWSNVPVSTSPPARGNAQMVSFGGSLLLGGGSAAGNALNDTWIFDGTTWSIVSGGVSPPPSIWAGLGNQVIAFGVGLNAQQLNENQTWSFDGTGWTKLSVSNPPLLPTLQSEYPAYWTTMIGVGGKIYLFGTSGVANPGPGLDPRVLDQTWSFDGSTWTQLTVTNPPSLRDVASMTRLAQLVVMIGWRSGVTYEFDGSNWTQKSVPNTLTLRTGQGMATLGNEIVVFGGTLSTTTGAPQILGDTWTFDGNTWQQLAISGPPPSASSSMASLGP